MDTEIMQQFHRKNFKKLEKFKNSLIFLPNNLNKSEHPKFFNDKNKID